MARVALLSRDLLFGSKVEGGLRAAGHEVTVYGSEDDVREADLLVVDLTGGDFDPAKVTHGVPTLGFYSHVDVETRRRAEEAGFDLVVPRSRMAREMAALVDRMVAA